MKLGQQFLHRGHLQVWTLQRLKKRFEGNASMLYDIKEVKNGAK